MSYFLISLFFLTFVLLLHKMFLFTDLIVNRGVSFSIVAKFLFAALPVLLLVTLPMSILISSILVFSRLSSDNESMAMIASGMTFYSQLIPVGVMGVSTAVLCGFLMMVGLPWSHDTTLGLHQKMLNSQTSTFDLREQVFHDGFDGIMFYVRNIEASGKVMKDIMISDTREAGKNRVIFAEHGMLIKSSTSPKIWLRLSNGTLHTVSDSQKSSNKKSSTDVHSVLPEYHYQIVRFGSYDLNFDFTKTIGNTKALRKSLRSFPLHELKSKLKAHDPGSSRYNAILVELHKKFALPFACLILAFLGAPLGVQNRRSGRHGGFALSLGVLILYYLLVTFAEGVAESGQISPSVAVWGPNIMLALLAGYMMQTVRRSGTIDIQGLILKPFSLFIRSNS